MPVQFREMNRYDYDAVVALWNATKNMGLSKADEEGNFNKFLLRNPGLNFVACRDEVVIGAVLCGHDGRRGALYHLAVSRNERKKGIGKKLVALCLDGLKNQGIERCHIHVYANNKEGLRFWENTGWFYRPELALLSIDIETE